MAIPRYAVSPYSVGGGCGRACPLYRGEAWRDTVAGHRQGGTAPGASRPVPSQQISGARAPELARRPVHGGHIPARTGGARRPRRPLPTRVCLRDMYGPEAASRGAWMHPGGRQGDARPPPAGVCSRPLSAAAPRRIRAETARGQRPPAGTPAGRRAAPNPRPPGRRCRTPPPVHNQVMMTVGAASPG